MGYALFCARKIALQSQISTLQYRMMLLSNKQQGLAEGGGALGDGAVSRSEWNSLGLFGKELVGGALQYAGSGGGISGNQGSGNDQSIMLSNKATESINYRIHMEEKKIENEMARLQTQLSAKTQELESVQKGEEQAIKAATPKYA